MTEERIGCGVLHDGATLRSAEEVTTVVDRRRTTTEWTFGAFGMPIRVEVFTKGLRQGEPASYVTTYAMNGTTGLVTHVVYPGGNRTDYTYPRRSTSPRCATGRRTPGQPALGHRAQLALWGVQPADPVHRPPRARHDLHARREWEHHPGEPPYGDQPREPGDRGDLHVRRPRADHGGDRRGLPERRLHLLHERPADGLPPVDRAGPPPGLASRRRSSTTSTAT